MFVRISSWSRACNAACCSRRRAQQNRRHRYRVPTARGGRRLHDGASPPSNPVHIGTVAPDGADLLSPEGLPDALPTLYGTALKEHLPIRTDDLLRLAVPA